jgi:hypothetical protein|tara:strand:- start:768 stop:1808 length:1041 start_codon:yes stop_codon:yes gene_type:complete
VKELIFKNIKKKLVFSFFIILSILVLFELILRIVNLGYLSFSLERSDVFHHKNLENNYFTSYDFSNEKEWNNVDIFYDDLGNRFNGTNKNKNKNSNKYIFLGDSFTEALQIRWEKTFVGLVEKKFKNHEIINLGVTTYSPSIYYLKIKQDINDYKNIDKLIIQIFNYDFIDDEYYKVYSNVPNISNPKEYISKLKYISPQKDMNRKREIVDFFKKQLKKSYLIRYLKKIQKTYFYQKVTWTNPTETFVRQNSITINALIKIKEICQSKNIDLSIFMIPDKKKLIKNENDIHYNEFKKIMKNNNFNFIDILPYFNGHNDLFFKKDLHLTEKGHGVLSTVLINYLMSN